MKRLPINKKYRIPRFKRPQEQDLTIVKEEVLDSSPEESKEDAGLKSHEEEDAGFESSDGDNEASGSDTQSNNIIKIKTK